jgi:preprotein translocase subunit YajC
MTIMDSLFSFFITDAHAAAMQSPTPAPNNFLLPVLMVVFVLFLYFTVWGPQRKRAREQDTMLLALAKGDEVVTIGGMVGKIAKLTDNYVVLSLSEGVDVTFQKSSIANALPKGTLKAL